MGTSGFAYDEWRGSFYPIGLRRRDMLPFYASRFDSVEINYTFRRQPTERVLASWHAATRPGFSFALKAHQRITHTLRLAHAAEAVAEFVGVAETLGARLGPILFQCPPTFAYEREALRSFLESIPPSQRYAFEFRHPSWSQARATVTSFGAWCIADTDESPAPAAAIDATAFAYLRLRRSNYTDEDLRDWASRIGDALERDIDVYCFFKHEDSAAGPAFAERLRALVQDNV